MSTIETRPKSVAVPPLVDGQRLDRATFHERYEAMPPETRAELIGGIVHMPSPVNRRHGVADKRAFYWLAHYDRYTPGLDGGSNVTVMLDDLGEPQPDQTLLIPGTIGGRTRLVNDYFVGPPELIVEIGKSTRKKDLGIKKADYERAGVREYLFVGVNPGEIRWFILSEGRYVDLAPGPDGLIRSEVFPGLWLDPAALIADDVEPLMAALELGLASPEHAAFVARLAEAKAKL